MSSKTQEILNTQDVLSMKGEGYYSKKTAGAKNAIDSIQEILESAILSLPQTDTLRFADFGAADGGTSQELWYNLINLLRRGGDKRAIEVIYTDLASNDFSTLFKNMQGMHGDRNFAYQKIFENVFVHGCGTGFHQQLLAKDSLVFGFFCYSHALCFRKTLSDKKSRTHGWSRYIRKKTVYGTSGERLGVNPSLKGRRTVAGWTFRVYELWD